jgi:hypothetical protein
MLLNAIYTRQHNEKSEAFFLLPTIEKTIITSGVGTV